MRVVIRVVIVHHVVMIVVILAILVLPLGCPGWFSGLLLSSSTSVLMASILDIVFNVGIAF